MSASRLGALLVLPTAALLLGGCPFSPDTTKPREEESKYLPQSSAQNCLINLRQAYVDRNVDEYVKLFDEEFAFVFSPAEAGEEGIPEFWYLAEERESTEHMFRSDTVDDIELNFDIGDTTSSNDEYADTWKVLVTQVLLRVHTRQPDGGQLTLEVSGGVAHFYFKRYANEQASDGNPVWRIYVWKDQPIGVKSETVAAPL